MASVRSNSPGCSRAISCPDGRFSSFLTLGPLTPTSEDEGCSFLSLKSRAVSSDSADQGDPAPQLSRSEPNLPPSNTLRQRLSAPPLNDFAVAALSSLGQRLKPLSFKRLHSKESKRLQENEVIFDPSHAEVGLAKRLRVLPESSFGWTQNCIVLDQQRLPDYIFTDFETLHNGKVVTEFAYIKEGYRRTDGSFVTESNKEPTDTPTIPDINYNLSIARDPAASYVRVITKNSYYRDLFTTMFRATMSLQSEYNNLTFISVILKRPDLNSNSASRTFVMIFISMFIVLECWRVRAAMNLAQREWDRDEKAGDLIKQPERVREGLEGDSIRELFVSLRRNILTRFEVFSQSKCMVFFVFLGVPKRVKDLPVMLHPWKAVQAFAAFKADGHRGYFLGYPNVALFRCEDEAALLQMLLPTICMMLVMTALKVYCTVTTEVTWLFFAINVIPSLVSFCLNMKSWHRMMQDRKNFKKWLDDRVANPPADHAERKVISDLLRAHFNEDAGFNLCLDDTERKKAAELAREKNRKKRCAELLRELQLWDAPDFLEAGLPLGVSPELAHRVIAGMRSAAEEGLDQSQLCRRGPKDDDDPLDIVNEE